jgi:hypothetical protein
MALRQGVSLFTRLLRGSTIDIASPDNSKARAEFSRLQSRQAQQFAILTEALVEGGNIDTWADAMRRNIRAYHTATMVIARGGSQNVSVADNGLLIELIVEQIRFLNRWVEQVRNTPIEERTARLIQRARLYANAGSQTFERFLAAANGIPSLPFYPADRTICKANCTCSWSEPTVLADGSISIHWILREISENCDTCLARDRVVGESNPIIIRNGVILDADRLTNPVLFD